MRNFVHAFVFALAAAVVPAGALAQEKSENPVVKSDKGISFEKPDGWVSQPGKKGVVARLNAAGGKSHIEVRTAPDVDAAKAKTFFTSFHASLQSAGLKKITETAAKKHGEHDGQETEYEMKNKDGESFRLVIWQIHNGSKAWMIVGFFETKEREPLYADFGKLISAIVFAK